MDDVYVYSTLTNDQKYTKYTTPTDNNIPQPIHSVLIKGGANMSSGSHPKFFTPHGVVTKVSKEDMTILMDDIDFKKHIKNGFIRVRGDEVHPDVAVAADMALSDDSAPKTPESPEFKAAGVKPASENISALDRLKGFLGVGR